jgi:KaiC/GvpD/RAD55 family RecA-like ATPase
LSPLTVQSVAAAQTALGRRRTQAAYAEAVAAYKAVAKGLRGRRPADWYSELNKFEQKAGGATAAAPVAAPKPPAPAAAAPAAAPAATAAAKKQRKINEARKARRAALRAMKAPEVKAIAKSLGIEGRAGMDRASLINAILRVEFKVKSKGKGVQLTAASLNALSIEQLRKLAAKRGITAGGKSKKILVEAILASRKERGSREAAVRAAEKLRAGTEGAVRYGVGPFRLIIAKGGKVIGDLGPYASARAATTDLKTLLRTAAPIEKYSISQKEGQALITAKKTGLEKKGSVVDGYVVVAKAEGAKDLKLDGFVYQPSDEKQRHAAASLSGFTFGKQGMRLSANGAFAAARRNLQQKLAKMNPGSGRRNTSGLQRRNAPVTFRTRDGRTISFNTRK